MRTTQTMLFIKRVQSVHDVSPSNKCESKTILRFFKKSRIHPFHHGNGNSLWIPCSMLFLRKRKQLSLHLKSRAHKQPGCVSSGLCVQQHINQHILRMLCNNEALFSKGWETRLERGRTPTRERPLLREQRGAGLQQALTVWVFRENRSRGIYLVSVDYNAGQRKGTKMA